MCYCASSMPNHTLVLSRVMGWDRLRSDGNEKSRAQAYVH